LSVTESAASLGLLVVCARTGAATQVESPTSAARRVTLIVIPVAPKRMARCRSTHIPKTLLEKLNCTLPSLPARGQRRSQVRGRSTLAATGEALRATIIGVGWGRERSLRRARKQGHRSGLVNVMVADSSKARRASAWRGSRQPLFRKKSSRRVDLLTGGLTVHDRHGLSWRAALGLRWSSLGRRSRRGASSGGGPAQGLGGGGGRRRHRSCRGYVRWRCCGLGNARGRRRGRRDDRFGQRRQR